MEIFTKYNRKDIQDRQIDTLIGLSKGLTADGVVNRDEANFLHSWLIQNQAASGNPLIQNLLLKVDAMLADDQLDAEESSELFSILRSISGEASAVGELSKTTSLPVNTPAPKIIFGKSSFLFTGTCAFGSRKQCQEIVESLGGINAGGVTKSLNYLILGTYVTDSWVHETFGRKIEKAIEYRDAGVPLYIVSEEHWLREANI